MVQILYFLCCTKEQEQEQEQEHSFTAHLEMQVGFGFDPFAHPISFNLPTMCTKQARN